MEIHRALNTGDMYTGAETAGSPDGDIQGTEHRGYVHRGRNSRLT